MTGARWVIAAFAVVVASSCGGDGDEAGDDTAGDVTLVAATSSSDEPAISFGLGSTVASTSPTSLSTETSTDTSPTTSAAPGPSAVAIAGSAELPPLCEATADSRSQPYGPTLIGFDVETGARKWSVCPTIPGDYRIVGTSGGLVIVLARTWDGVWEVAAFDTASGLQRWRRAPHDAQAGMYVAVDTTSVYVSESPEAVLALDAATGAQRWQSEPGGGIATGDGGVIVVQWTGDPEVAVVLHMLDAGSGAERWRLDLEPGIPHVDVDSATVLTTLLTDRSDGQSAVVAVDAATGTELWRGAVEMRPGVVHGVVLAVETVDSIAGELVARDVRDGTILWHHADITVRPGPPDGRPVAWQEFASAIQFVDGSPLIGALDVTTGRFTSLRPLSADDSTPAGVGEGLMVVPAHADVVVVDMVSGAQQWRAAALPPEVAAGTVNGFLNNATVTGDTVVVAASNESGVTVRSLTGDARLIDFGGCGECRRAELMVSPDGASLTQTSSP